jgi:hypothetical protein
LVDTLVHLRYLTYKNSAAMNIDRLLVEDLGDREKRDELERSVLEYAESLSYNSQDTFGLRFISGLLYAFGYQRIAKFCLELVVSEVPGIDTVFGELGVKPSLVESLALNPNEIKAIGMLVDVNYYTRKLLIDSCMKRRGR